MPATLDFVDAPHAPVRMTRRGKIYTPRISQDEFLDLLGLGQSREATMSRLEEYLRLFAYKYSGAIVTKTGCGPGGWTAYKRPLGIYQIALHLLANRIPGRQPIWFGSRSLPRSRYLCLDVDADRTPEQILAKKYPWHEEFPEHVKTAELRGITDDLASRPTKPPQAERIALVKQALRRMGINPDNPRSVLNLGSPSGGRHIYVFFDNLYFLDQFTDLLHAAGLRHVPGEIEFYPSATHSFRLPFGYLPGQAHDPHAWIQFIDDFRNGSIIRHSLQDLYASLEKHRSTQHRRIKSLKKAAPAAPERPKPCIMGIPNHLKTPTPLPSPTHPGQKQRSLQLLDDVHSFADARELLNQGIVVDGTRTKALKVLAAHLIWFKGLAAEDAAKFLTEWAMSTRHVSKDIKADLTNGTTVVAEHIKRMCRWYEAKKIISDHPPFQAIHEFSHRELDAIRASVANLTGEDKANQAEFLLHFLRFAKRHGSAAIDGTGWNAAVHAGKVIRRWPGCSHMKYKKRIDYAKATGILIEIKGPWHRAGRPGRATTYRLSIPVVPEIQWVLTYEAALEAMTEIGPSVNTEKEPGPESPPGEEPTDASNPTRPTSGDPADSDGGAFPPTVPPACPGTSLDSGARQCNPQPDAAPGLPCRSSQELRAASAIDLLHRIHHTTERDRHATRQPSPGDLHGHRRSQDGQEATAHPAASHSWP
jgi:hypothetical protein